MISGPKGRDVTAQVAAQAWDTGIPIATIFFVSPKVGETTVRRPSAPTRFRTSNSRTAERKPDFTTKARGHQEHN